MAAISNDVAHLFALRHMMELLWRNYLRDNFDDPIAALGEAATAATLDIERMYKVSHQTDREGLHLTVQRILNNEDEIWGSIRDRLLKDEGGDESGDSDVEG
jgi:hypothetical protein